MADPIGKIPFLFPPAHTTLVTWMREMSQIALPGRGRPEPEPEKTQKVPKRPTAVVQPQARDNSREPSKSPEAEKKTDSCDYKQPLSPIKECWKYYIQKISQSKIYSNN